MAYIKANATIELESIILMAKVNKKFFWSMISLIEGVAELSILSFHQDELLLAVEE
ncbi:MAG: hypothetical protein BTN85_1218 [Candidatus Methanohalarchaeum thermophilum]|uniref:Uncharacterized protein n=1 Tax=Methanohalarchaeum thermophilum TaxID=1903181 RepID=A0A1Q6DWI3_METT1|nr:MAG: hypothetical protein BTN85_1218 [Candidatus Methanohalarchaeum thermophilum]